MSTFQIDKGLVERAKKLVNGQEATRLHITYSSPISNGELRKMVEAVEDTSICIETKGAVKQLCFSDIHNSSHGFLGDLFDVLERMAKAWEKRGKNSGRWVDCVRCSS
jgi:hypothetical protein